MARTVLFTIVLVVVLVLAGGTAKADSIVGSFHDLDHIDDVHMGPSGWGRTFDDYNQVCVYCHTPHNASSTQKPLWNRPETTAVFQVYTSPSMLMTPGQPGAVSRLCLSCHDGTIAVDKVLNTPNTGMESDGVHGSMIVPREQPLIDCFSCHTSRIFGVYLYSAIGTDLSNDHPVAMDYPVKEGLVPLPQGGRFANGIRLVDGRPTCHNAHDPANRPFLWTSNDGSALCYTCHIK